MPSTSINSRNCSANTSGLYASTTLVVQAMADGVEPDDVELRRQRPQVLRMRRQAAVHAMLVQDDVLVAASGLGDADAAAGGRGDEADLGP